jgi:hypothetical protein
MVRREPRARPLRASIPSPRSARVSGAVDRNPWMAALETAARVLPVAVLMLPIMGAVYRWISFSYGQPYVPAVVAVHMPVADLAMVAATEGLVRPLLAMPFLLLSVAMLRYLHPHMPPGVTFADLLSFRYRRLFRSPRRIGLFIAFLIPWLLLLAALVARGMLTVIELLQPLLVLLLVLVGGVPLLWYLGQPPQPPPMRRTIPIVALLVIVGAILAGLVPNRAGSIVADLKTVDGASLSSGRYVILGEVDGMVWLLPCSNPSAAIQASTQTIALKTLVRVHPKPPSSVWGDIFIPPSGFTPACD